MQFVVDERPGLAVLEVRADVVEDVDVQVLVGRPAKGAVVEDNVFALVVYGRAFVAGAKANVAEHDVVDAVADDEVAARNRDAAAGADWPATVT